MVWSRGGEILKRSWFEILKQIYWESLRAPTDDVTSQRNPYRRETIKKKFFGKTKEERDSHLKYGAGE